VRTTTCRHPCGAGACRSADTPLAATVEALRDAGVHFRNDIVTGVGGKQILLDDPSGNPVELFEPTLPEASLSGPS
jgi:hypothetical protein